MALHLYAGIPVSDVRTAVDWYGRLLDDDRPYRPDDSEAVWDLDAGRSLYVVLDPHEAGRALVSFYLDGPGELAHWLAHVETTGIRPWSDETYRSGVRRVEFHDPDGNEIVLGGLPAA